MLLQWSIFLFLYLLEDSDALFLTESQSFHPSIAILSFLYSSLRLPPPFPPAPVPIGSKRGTTLPHHPDFSRHLASTSLPESLNGVGWGGAGSLHAMHDTVTTRIPNLGGTRGRFLLNQWLAARQILLGIPTFLRFNARTN